MSNLLFFCLIALSTLVAAKDPGYSFQGLKYVGSRRATNEPGRTRSEDNKDYFISENKLTWGDAQKFCRDNTPGYLLSIETPDEDLFIQEDVLSGNGNYDAIWTSGFNNGVWTWESTRKPFIYTNWGEGHPKGTGSIYRVLYINDHNTLTHYWHTVTSTSKSFYICEIPLSPEPVPCKRRNDLVIVLDASGSIGADNFEKTKDFVAKLAGAFGQPSRTSLVVYSSSVQTVYPLNNNLGPAGIEAAIRGALYPGGGTATDLGIDAAVSQLITSAQDVPRKMVVFTDGLSNYPQQTQLSAERAKAAGITAFSVGIVNYNRQELLAIAANNTNHVFTTDNFDSLIDLIAPVCVKVCLGS